MTTDRESSADRLWKEKRNEVASAAQSILLLVFVGFVVIACAIVG